MSKSYTDAIKHDSYGDRLNYLALYDNNAVSPRHMSNSFYKSKVWLAVRKEVIARDLGYDLGVVGCEIVGPPLVHHINPVSEQDILDWNEDVLLNPDNLITVSKDTHNRIHYRSTEPDNYVERKPGDTKLW